MPQVSFVRNYVGLSAVLIAWNRLVGVHFMPKHSFKCFVARRLNQAADMQINQNFKKDFKIYVNIAIEKAAVVDCVPLAVIMWDFFFGERVR